MLIRTLERFEPLGLLEGAVIVVAPGTGEEFRFVLRSAFPQVAFSLVEGAEHGKGPSLTVFGPWTSKPHSW